MKIINQIMGLPTKLTHEEQALLNKFALLRKKRKASLDSKSPTNAVESKNLPVTPTKKEINTHSSNKESTVAPKDAKEIAKKLIASGQVKISKESGARSFKRAKTSLSEKKTVEPGPLFSSKEQTEKIENIRRESYNKFVSSEANTNTSEAEHEDKSNRFDNGRKGTNLFVTGYGLTKNILDTSFHQFGQINNIYFDQDKGHGYVTYQKHESAEDAIAELHGSMIQSVTLRVMYARRRPYDDNRFTWRPSGAKPDNPGRQRWEQDGRSLDAPDNSRMADHSPVKKAAPREKRKLVSYDNAEFDF